MKQLGIPASPRNFAVWYTYFSGINPDLKQMIDVLHGNHQPFTDMRCLELYDRFFGFGREGAALQDAGSKIGTAVSRVLELVNQAGGDANRYGASLAGLSGDLKASRAAGQVRSIIQRIVSETGRMQEQAQRLEKQLLESSEKVDGSSPSSPPWNIKGLAANLSSWPRACAAWGDKRGDKRRSWALHPPPCLPLANAPTPQPDGRRWLAAVALARPAHVRPTGVAAVRFEFMDRTMGIEREHRTEERKLKAVYEELRRHSTRGARWHCHLRAYTPMDAARDAPPERRGGGRRPNGRPPAYFAPGTLV